MDKQLVKTLLELKPKATNNNGCWIWTDSHFPSGYGKLVVDGRSHVVSRLAAYLYHDFDLEDKTSIVCHRPIICSDKACWNPDHIYIGSFSSNEQDKRIDGTGNSGKTKCPKGHEYTEANTVVRNRPGGRLQRECRTCVNERRQGKYSRTKTLAKLGVTFPYKGNSDKLKD
jgi:hypothetical protein